MKYKIGKRILLEKPIQRILFSEAGEGKFYRQQREIICKYNNFMEI